jgi:hypothetical protein
VAAIRTASALTRGTCAALFALLLALRVLSPAGFMPDFSGGGVTIVRCPDAAPVPAMHHAAGEHHGKSQAAHQPCPYAAAPPLAAATAEAPRLAPVLRLAAPPLIGGPLDLVEPARPHLRPPLRGPPIPA